MKQIGVKFCGGCNPQINRAQVFIALKQIIAEEFQVVTAQGKEPWEKAVLICGCPVACADSPEVRKLAQYWVIVSGSMVEKISVSEKEIPQRIKEKLDYELLTNRGI